MRRIAAAPRQGARARLPHLVVADAHLAARARAFHLVVNTHLVMPSFTVRPVPLFDDNYAYLIVNAVHRTAVLVDPADAGPALAAAAASDCELVGVLTTHHHRDHSGGNAAVAAARPGVAIVGGAAEHGRVPAATRLVADGERFELGGLTFTALHTPCHTKGHVCYVLDGDPDQPPAVFTGDTLFGGGVGKFFEGDAATMAGSLAKLTTALPPTARVYCGHEYTAANLRFGAHVEPGNAALAARAEAVAALRAAGRPSVPSTLGEEAATNVFLRTREPGVWGFTHTGWREEQQARRSRREHRHHHHDTAPTAAAAADDGGADAGGPDPVEVLARLREAKNAWKG